MKFLKDVLGNELYNQVEEKLRGNNKIELVNALDGNYIKKEVHESEVKIKEALEKQIKDIEYTVNSLIKDAKGEKLEEKIKDFQDNIRKEKDLQEKAVKDLQLQTAIKLSVANKVHDVDVLINLINKEQIVLDDKGNIKSGLKEQLEDLQKSKSFLFAEKDKNTLSGIEPAESNKKSSTKSSNSGNEPIDKSVEIAKSIASSIKAETNIVNPYFN